MSEHPLHTQLIAAGFEKNSPADSAYEQKAYSHQDHYTKKEKKGFAGYKTSTGAMRDSKGNATKVTNPVHGSQNVFHRIAISKDPTDTRWSHYVNNKPRKIGDNSKDLAKHLKKLTESVKFLFSLYESQTGERIVTTSVKGEMGIVLKEITDLIKQHETTYGEGHVILKTLKLQTESKVIVNPVKMESLSTLLSLASEHYKQQTGTSKLMVENSTPKKNSILENLKKVLNNPSKMAKLVAELDLHEVDTKYHEVASQHGLTWKRGGPDSGDYEGRHHTLYSKSGEWAVQDNRGNEVGKGKTKASAHKFLSTLKELELPSLDKGDILLVGKFKNRRARIEGFDTDENGQPIAVTNKGPQKIFKPRIQKLEKDK